MCSRSPQNLKFGHFTLLFCRGRQRSVQNIKRTCRAIVLWRSRSRYRRRRRYLSSLFFSSVRHSEFLCGKPLYTHPKTPFPVLRFQFPLPGFSNIHLYHVSKNIKVEKIERMIKIRARFQQIVPPSDHIEFSVDPFNLFLSRPARACA